MQLFVYSQAGSSLMQQQLFFTNYLLFVLLILSMIYFDIAIGPWIVQAMQNF